MKNIVSKIARNWKSGLTVALVSIPLSVSLAVASGTSPVVGILTAIWAGIAASIFGGSNFNIVGPTGALSGILVAYAVIHGAETLPMIAILTGVFVLVAYFFKLERYLVFVPGSAIHGFTLGVALIIGLNQLNFALGLSGLPKHEKFVENVMESLAHVGSASIATILFFVGFLAFLMIWKRRVPKFPGPIVVAVLGILLGIVGSFYSLPFSLATLGSLYPDLSPALFLPTTFTFSQSMVAPALAVAFVAILETILSAKIADGMTKTKHNKHKEVRGLAVANILAGVMGGMPATAALARTSLNVKTGADDKMSATVSSIAIAVISLFFLTYFKYIPLAVIAAILVYVAISMVETEHFKRMFFHDKKNFYLSLATAGVTVYWDPIIGILLGVGVALLVLVEKISRGQFDMTINDKNKRMVDHVRGDMLEKAVEGSDTVVYSFDGLLCYLNSEAHSVRIAGSLGEAKNIILRFRNVCYIDMDGVETLDEIIQTAQAHGTQIFITGVNPVISPMLDDSCMYMKLKEEGKVFEKSTDALISLGFNL